MRGFRLYMLVGGMSLTKDISKFKIFCADTGLFVTLKYFKSEGMKSKIPISCLLTGT